MTLIPPQYLLSVVSLEVEGKDLQGNAEMRSIATGFLYGKRLPQTDAAGTAQYVVFVVTNRHVVEDRTGEWMKEISVRFNLRDPTLLAKHYRFALLDSKSAPIWLRHTNSAVDIAVIPINAAGLRSENI